MTEEIKKTDNEKCMNCGEALQGVYCSACGQKHVASRLNAVQLAKSALLSVLDLESTAWNTFKGLVRNPGLVALEYIQGRRSSYINPIKYFLTGIAVYLSAVALTFGLEFLANQMVHIDPNIDPEKLGVRAGVAMKSVIREHMNLITFLSLPLFALVMRWQYFRSGHNYAETVCFLTFLMGQAYLYETIFILLMYLIGSYDQSPGIIATLVLFAFGIKGFYSLTWARAILSGLVSAILYSLVSVGVGGLLIVAKIQGIL